MDRERFWRSSFRASNMIFGGQGSFKEPSLMIIFEDTPARAENTKWLAPVNAVRKQDPRGHRTTQYDASLSTLNIKKKHETGASNSRTCHTKRFEH